MRDPKSGCSLMGLGFLGLAFMLIGLYAALIQSWHTDQEIAAIQRLPELNVVMFHSIPAGSFVAITGILSDPAHQTKDGELFIYLEEEWKVNQDEDKGWQGYWETVQISVPESVIILTDGEILILGRQREELQVSIEAPLHEVRRLTPQEGEQVDGVVPGSIRDIGFRVGDQLTITGKKSAAGVIPDRIFGGSRAELIVFLEQRILGLRILGIIFGIVGLGLLVTALKIYRAK